MTVPHGGRTRRSIPPAKRRRWVDDTPTSKTTGVFIGTVEVKGDAESEQPLVSHLARRWCVCYSWSVEEHWSRMVMGQARERKDVVAAEIAADPKCPMFLIS